MDAALEDRDSATYSIESEPSQPNTGNRFSVDDVILPTVRRSAIQIVSQPISPRRQAKQPVNSGSGTMQIMKLVLKTPPGSPKRQPRSSGIVIKSIQTLAGPGLISGFEHQDHGTVRQKPSVLMDNARNVPDETAPYRIIPIGEPSVNGASSRKDFEARRAERERTTNEFQDFLRESFKENKTPPSTPPSTTPVPSTSSAIEITHISAKECSASEKKSVMHGQNLAKSSILTNGTNETVFAPVDAVIAGEQPSQCVLDVPIASPPIPAARHSLLLATQKPPDVVQTPAHLHTDKSSMELQLTDNQESQIAVEPTKPSRSTLPIRPKQQDKPSSKTPAKSTTVHVNEPPKKKEKSYDPARAREFIREQQAKRRQEKKETPGATTSGSTKAPSEKDLIKQRLQSLRQSQQKLVSKNLQKVRTRSQSCAPKAAESPHKDNPPVRTSAPNDHHRMRPTTTGPPATNLRKFASTPTLRLNKHPLPASAIQKNTIKPPSSSSDGVPLSRPSVVSHPIVSGKSQATAVRTSSRPASASSDKLPSTVSSKIGILRKPDDLALEDIVPPSPLKPDSSSQPTSVKANGAQHVCSTSTMPNARLIIINADSEHEDKTIAEAEKELKLDVPNVSLVPSNSAVQIPEKLPENRPAEEQHQHVKPIKSIPPWLKESLRHPDPYPFIVAVRRKLEAARSVREEEGNEKNPVQVREKAHVEEPVRSVKSHAYLDAIDSVPCIRKTEHPNNDRSKQVMAPPIQRRSSAIPAEGSIILTNISEYASSNTTSEISSIKSDIPPPMPPLLCSTRIEVPAEATVRPLSPAAPISPLSMERISLMKIASPKPSLARKSPPIDQDKEGNSSILQGRQQPGPLPPSITSKNRAPELADRSQKELEYQRLLESFNRSLTHVIEVNQQLYSALKNVPAPSAVPPEILRIRDEMTQTSQPLVIIPTETVQKVAAERNVSTTVDLHPSQATAGETPTTASNYSDDFEHQSQTGDAPRTPERKLSPHTGGLSVSTSSSIASSASSSSSSSSSAGNGSTVESGNTGSSSSSDNSSSSSASSSSSNEGVSAHNSQLEQQQKQQYQAKNQTNTMDGGRKKRTASNTTAAHSSDFDSRSFSLSDSHNNTANNHPPMPDEYLPSFEESLRRSKLSSASNGSAKNRPSVQQDASRDDGTSTISERIDRTNEERSFSLKHSEEPNELKLDASLPLATDTDEGSMDKSTLKNEPGSNAALGMNADTTINSDLLAAMFNRTDLEVSILSATVSETNLSYSSIGLFDQLINSEKSREEQLVSRVHAKQKSLLNRAKGQLAWLELQKQRYREKGMTEHISAIKKKQRAILLRLEKDRTELNRTIKNSMNSSPTATTTARTPLTARNVDSKLNSYCSSPTLASANAGIGSFTLRKTSSGMHHASRHSPQRQRRIAGSTVTTTTTTTTSNSIQIAIRGRELEPNDRLEDILLRREAELRKRKEHVQRLLEWHRKLEQEEEELLAVESKLLAYNSRKLESTTTTTVTATPKEDRSIEARVRNIERSLKTLQTIPSTVSRRVEHNRSAEHEDKEDEKEKQQEEEEEVVKTGGSKLNRLWYRLTGIKEQRYESGRNYPITRAHLEALYEDAKRCVLEGFQRNDGQLAEALLERSHDGRSRSGAGETTTGESVEGNVSLQTMIEGEQTVRVVEEEAAEQQSRRKPSREVEKEAPENVLPGDEEESNGMEADEEQRHILFSSTVVNGWSPGSRRSIESVEFHTLEETGTHCHQSAPDGLAEEEPAKSESYSMTFEEQPSAIGHDDDGDDDPDTTDGQQLAAVGEDSQSMIEDMSLPPTLLNNTSILLNEAEEDAATASSSCESSITVELSVPLIESKVEIESDSRGTKEVDEMVEELDGGSDGSGSTVQSLEEATGSSVVTTPTTVTPTLMASEAIEERKVVTQESSTEGQNSSSEVQPEGTEDAGSELEEEEEEDDIFHLRSSHVSSRTDSPSSCASELEKRLATLHDELEELSETFERTPFMKSPTSPKTKPTNKEDHMSTSTSTKTGETDTFVGKERSSDAFGASVKNQPEKESSTSVVVVAKVTTTVTAPEQPIAATMGVKVRPQATSTPGEGFSIASGSAANHRAAPPNHQGGAGEGIGAFGATSPPLSPPAVVRMPDIINEAEVLRRQQLQIEQEIKELEQQVGFFREIPNKPPPPYIPPANGSPLALLFPGESRIDELIDRRIEELHRDRIPPERLRSEHVTNVYEKLILDMCKELYRELRPADPTVSFRTIAHDKRPLVFYNPPDALRCMKDYLRARIRRVLNEEQLALQQQHQHQHHQQQQQLLLHHHQLQQQQQQQHHHHHQPHSSPPHVQLQTQQQQQQQQQQHLLHHCATMPFLFANGGWCASRRKRDQVDEILAQEMHDDDTRWTNFDREEIEVKDRITDELLKSLLTEALHDMAVAFRSKAKGAGRKEVPMERKESAM